MSGRCSFPAALGGSFLDILFGLSRRIHPNLVAPFAFLDILFVLSRRVHPNLVASLAAQCTYKRLPGRLLPNLLSAGGARGSHDLGGARAAQAGLLLTRRSRLDLASAPAPEPSAPRRRRGDLHVPPPPGSRYRACSSS